jgi:hypothetical protein
MMLDDGQVAGRSVVAAEWIADTLRGGEDSVAAFAADEHAVDYPGGHYRPARAIRASDAMSWSRRPPR